MAEPTSAELIAFVREQAAWYRHSSGIYIDKHAERYADLYAAIAARLERADQDSFDAAAYQANKEAELRRAYLLASEQQARADRMEQACRQGAAELSVAVSLAAHSGTDFSAWADSVRLSLLAALAPATDRSTPEGT